MKRDGCENSSLNEKADKVQRYENAIPIVKEYKSIIKSKKKNILNIVYTKGRVFKEFKESENVINMVKKTWPL